MVVVLILTILFVILVGLTLMISFMIIKLKRKEEMVPTEVKKDEVTSAKPDNLNKIYVLYLRTKYNIKLFIEKWKIKQDKSILARNIFSQKSQKIKIKSELFNEVLGTKEYKKVEPIKIKEMLMLGGINITTTIGIVEKIEKDEIELALKIPIVTLKGDNIGIARNIDSHWRLIGWGKIIESSWDKIIE